MEPMEACDELADALERSLAGEDDADADLEERDALAAALERSLDEEDDGDAADPTGLGSLPKQHQEVLHTRRRVDHEANGGGADALSCDGRGRCRSSALRTTLTAATAEGGSSSSHSTPTATQSVIGHGLVCWPLEVRLCIATYLSFAELVVDSALCRTWRQLEAEDTLWKVYYQLTWPRLARREELNAVTHQLSWRARFRASWKQADRAEDALEEDWLDLAAAQDLRPMPPLAQRRLTESERLERQLAQAERHCREVLCHRGVIVPAATDAKLTNHVCSKDCVHHRLLHGCDAFLCQSTGVLHRCSPSVACAGCMISSDDCFFVCPASGRCYPKVVDATEEREAAEAAQAWEVRPQHDWDPGLSMTQQFGVWFEQGYSMTEEQAKEFFNDERQGLSRGA